MEELIAFYKENMSREEKFCDKEPHVPRDYRLRAIYELVMKSKHHATKRDELTKLVTKRFEKHLGKGQPITFPPLTLTLTQPTHPSPLFLALP